MYTSYLTADNRNSVKTSAPTFPAHDPNNADRASDGRWKSTCFRPSADAAHKPQWSCQAGDRSATGCARAHKSLLDILRHPTPSGSTLDVIDVRRCALIRSALFAKGQRNPNREGFIMYMLSVSTPVNPDGVQPVLTMEQVWTGLVMKGENALPLPVWQSTSLPRWQSCFPSANSP